MAVSALGNGGRVDNVIIVMHALPVADYGVVLAEVFTHVYLVDHQRHVNRVSGVRVYTLARVVTQDAQADFPSRSTVNGEWVVTSAITGLRCNDVAWHRFAITGRYEMIKLVGDIGAQVKFTEVTHRIYTEGGCGVGLVVFRQDRSEFIFVSSDT